MSYLVLERRTGQDILIGLPDGTTVTVSVHDLRGDRVRLAFDAPPNVPINRREVNDSVRRRGSIRGDLKVISDAA